MKQLLPFAVILFFCACTQTSRNKETAILNASAENRKIVETLFEHFNRHDWAAMADLYIDSAQMQDPSFGITSVIQSKQATIKKYSELERMFPDVKDSVAAIYIAGNNHVVVEFISTGTAQDGKKFILPVCSVLTIENGKIVKDYTYYDNQ
jgi:ketosteroid isomerase-like protein